jgi:glycosyltransferase involved in cell wall biosynthesis
MKVVFIMNAVGAPRSVKRINEFIANGFEVEIYGFQRTVFSSDPSMNVGILGKLDDGNKYIKAQLTILKGIYPILKKHRKEKVVYYFFGLIIAQIAILFTNKKYIYEESDMNHLVKNKFVGALLECSNKNVIKKSLETVLTSEGFLKYHYGYKIPDNITIIPNKLDVGIKQFRIIKKNIDIVNFGFVGGVRYRALYQFAKIIGCFFSDKVFHFFGTFFGHDEEKRFDSLRQYQNIFFHGKYSGYKDLPQIYAQIDILVATYDVDSENVRKAEPNKLYDAIYFEKPIIVSKNTFLAEKVQKLGIGYALNVENYEEVIDFIKSLTKNDLEKKVANCRLIPKDFCINDNSAFFTKLKNKREIKYYDIQ